jgi:Uma2 family endonuclease
MNVADKLKLTEAEYLESELNTAEKHEFLDGECWAMGGASDAHVTVTLSLSLILKNYLKGKSCRVYAADMRVQVAAADAYFYPDVLVTCSASDREQSLYKSEPSFIAEVLSPSTEAFDRGEKFSYYRQLDSLQEYWLITPEKGVVDVFTKANQGDWMLHSYQRSKDQRIPLKSLGFMVSTTELFEDVLNQ